MCGSVFLNEAIFLLIPNSQSPSVPGGDITTDVVAKNGNIKYFGGYIYDPR